MSPRQLAIAILARVRATDAFLNVVVDAQLSEHRLTDERDTGLVTELCYGATRRQLTLDHVLSAFLDRPLEKLEDRVLAALRVGAYQLLYLRVPAHAAVGETVQALKELGVARASGLVNAVLRKVGSLEAIPLPPSSERIRHLAVRESHPEWLVERWCRQFGPERAEAMLLANNQAPPLVVRVNSTRGSRDEVLARLRAGGLEARPTAISPWGISLSKVGSPEALLGYAEGDWQVQDEAAQLVGLYADIALGARVLDVCAAPGGKACHLAEAHPVVATDLHEAKLARLRAEAARLGLGEKIRALRWDATTPPPEGLGEFPAVLVDAPCTGLGTLRRHPELRYRRKEEDLARLAALQRSILEQAQACVAPGGLLVYAVCSVDSQEGIDQMDAFLRSHPEFTLEPGEPTLPLPLHQGYLRTLPGPEGLDGFFAARLRRLD